LSGGVSFSFKPGTVIPPRSEIFVSPNVKAFRARALSPRGGERRLVVGPYSGDLSAWGDTLLLNDDAGRLVSSKTFVGDPSAAQQSLRVTGLFYDPDPLPGWTNLDAQQFECIELQNIGFAPLDLRGVKLTHGIQFDFSSGTLTNLAAGERVLVVSDTNAFALRYGSQPVTGQYVGNLENSGERLRLEDAYGEKILDFAYDGRWYADTQGEGACLAVLNATLPSSAWSAKENWLSAPAPDPGEGFGLPPAHNQLMIQPAAGGGFRVRYGGSALRPCELQCSSDLGHWSRVAELTGSASGVVQYLEPPSSARATYYRILQK